MLAQHFKGKGGTIVVAVGLDEHTEALMRSAVSLAEQTQMSLRLVHVIEPWVGRYWATAVAGGVPMTDIVQNVESEQTKSAEEKLADLVYRFGDRVSCSYAVLLGIVADAILEDAEDHEAALIITGSAGDYQRFVPRGFSTALSLLAHAEVPVIVIPRNVEVDFKRDHIKLLLADDLAPESERIVPTTFNFAGNLCHPELVHLHVNSVGAEHLHDALTTAFASLHTEIDPGTASKDVAGAMQSAMEKGLLDRLPANRGAFENAGGTYQAKITVGQAADGVNSEADKLKADMVVFGRHQTFHRRPFLIGRMPFHSMLSHRHAVMVVPLEQRSQ